MWTGDDLPSDLQEKMILSAEQILALSERYDVMIQGEIPETKGKKGRVNPGREARIFLDTIGRRFSIR